MRRLAPLLALAAVITVGCGPSLRRVHRSEVYFERCYAADLDDAVPLEERRACWQAWMQHWHSVAEGERVDYVRERLLRLDPERAAILALATGGADADPVPLTETTPAIAAEAQVVQEASRTTPEEAASATVAPVEPLAGAETEEIESERVAADARAPIEPRIELADEGAPRVIEEPAPPPRDVPSARDRRHTRPPVMPVVDPPHCAEACRPAWLQCVARCEEYDRAACHRACRLQLRTCARACY